MKKIILAVLVCLSISTQAQSYKQGQIDFNVGMGLGNTFMHARSYGYGYGYSYRSIPTFNASGEYAVTNAIGVGGYLAYTSLKQTYTSSWYHSNGNYYAYTDQFKWSFFIIGARAAYHFDEFIKIDKLDVYSGLMLGYNIARVTYTSSDASRNGIAYYGSSYGGLAWSLFAGARYRFTDKIGAFVELGYGVTVLNLGLNIKLN
jgi:hypothetical protein